MLRSEHPESREVPRDEMEENVRLLLTKAESYGLETEEQIGTYVMVAWIMGPDFDTKYPAAVDVLPATHFSAEEKSEWLVEWSDRIISALKSP